MTKKNKDIKVFPVEMIPLDKINPASYNPRKISNKELKKLENSMTEFGFLEPVIYNKTTGNIVGGHQRFSVLKKKGIKEVQCTIVELSEEQEKLANIALNKVSGEWDSDKLEALLMELNNSDADVLLSGFDREELDELIGSINDYDDIEENPLDKSDEVIESFKIIIEFQSETEQAEAFEKLVAEGYDCKVLIL